jgi:hypothetical protein
VLFTNRGEREIDNEVTTIDQQEAEFNSKSRQFRTKFSLKRILYCLDKDSDNRDNVVVVPLHIGAVEF